MRIAMIGQKGFGVGERGGGIERHVTELATRLGAMGEDVTVYVREPSDEDLPPGVIVKEIGSIKTKNFETITHTFLSTLDAMRGNFDIIHYHGVGPATLAWIPRLFKRNAQVVVTFHSQDRYHKKWGWVARQYLTFGEWAAVWFPHATIAVSHFLAVYIRKQLYRQAIFIPNGASLRFVDSKDKLSSFGLRPQSYLLSVSRLEPHKGQQYLIEAFQTLSSQEPELMSDLQLVIVGAETYGAEYQAQLSRLARGNVSIRFLGFQSGEVLDQLFAHARLFVHASEVEGLPIVVLEAMSFGLPVLVSDIPENLEALHHTGFTFTSESVPDLVKVLAGLLRHPRILDQARGESRSIINQFFNWDTIAQETLAVYRSLLH
ncbi:MAG TPA: glycosyltransferase family 4 protein [Patescibacteria group bacterium]|nr:glycosyltransferase family 4 protein [Patescibacteria group bacterium]